MSSTGKNVSPISRDFWSRMAMYVSVLSAYLAVVRSDALAPLQLALFGGACLWSLALEHRFPRLFLTQAIKIGVIITGSTLFTLFILGNMRGSTQGFSNSFARFLLWNATVFVASRNKTEHDVWVIGIIDLCLFVISGHYVQPSDFLLLFGLSFFALVYVFTRLALLRCGSAGEKEWRGIGLCLFQFAFAIEVAALVFIAFPRHVFRVNPKKPDLAEKKPEIPKEEDRPAVPTGDGRESRVGPADNPEELDPTVIGRLKKDMSDVLLLKILEQGDAGPEQLQYLRGSVLDTYENGRWRSRFRKRTAGDSDDGMPDGWTPIPVSTRGRGPLVRQQITMKPVGGDLAFAYGEPVRIQRKEMMYDPIGVLFFPGRQTGRTEYVIESRLPDLSDPSIDEVSPRPTADRYLQIPSEGLAELRRAAREVGIRPANTRRKVKLLMDWLLRQNLTYRLAPFVPQGGRDPIEYFLFEKREGFCIHFASSLVLLCRAAGIPARLATGFLVTRYDAATESWIVKNADAHAWVEVYFNEHGWIAFDPTPAGAPPGMAEEGTPVATGDTKNKKDEAGAPPPEPPRRWDSVVLDYDTRSQDDVLRGFFAWVGRGLRKVWAFLSHPLTWGFVAAVAVLVAAGYLILPAARRRRLRQLLGGFRGETSVDFYRDFLWHFSRRGLRKRAGATGWEFAEQARRVWSDDDVTLITEKFYKVRYRGERLDPSEELAVAEVLKRMDEMTPEPGRPE